MTDTEFKPTTMGSRFVPPSSRKLSHPAELRRTPATLAARAQDTQASGFRVLLNHGTGGSVGFHVGNGAPSLATSPDHVTWRTVAQVMETTTPGTVLTARCVSVPSGSHATAPSDPADPVQIGVGGQARLLFEWHNEGGDVANATAGLQLAGPSPLADGAEELAQGAAFAQLHHAAALVIRPPGAANIPAARAKWSEVNTVRITLQVKGGARLVNVTVSEAPTDHAAEHDAVNNSTNGVPADLSWPVKIPQTSQVDGATYEEHRFGVEQAMRVAVRQTEVIGPAVARWGSYTDAGTLPTSTTPAPRVITTSGITTGAAPPMERVSAPGASSTWARQSPGFWIQTTGQQPDARREAGRGARTYATLRVRLRVHVRFASAGAGVGLFRLQTTERSWINMRPDRAVIGDAWTWLTTTRTLEANIASDDTISGAPYASVQDFASRGSSAADMEIDAWDLLYGWTPVHLGQ